MALCKSILGDKELLDFFVVEAGIINMATHNANLLVPATPKRLLRYFFCQAVCEPQRHLATRLNALFDAL